MKNKNIPLHSLLQKLLYFSPFIFPFYLLKFQISGIPFTVPELYSYGLFALWVSGLVLRHMAPEWGKPLRYYWISAFVLFLGCSIGVLTSPHYIDLPGGEVLDAHHAALGVWKGWVLAPMLYFAVLTQTLKKEDEVNSFLRYFVLSGAAIALAAYVFAVFANGITYDLRLSGFFESANYLSLYLVPAFLLSVYFMIHQRGKSRFTDYVNLACLIIMAHAILFTQSYAAIIAVFGAMMLYVFYLIVGKRFHVRSLIIGSLVLIATFSLIIFTQINTPKFQQFLDWENRSSTSVRLEIYEVAWNLIGQNFLTGVGPGLFQANYQISAPDVLGHAPMEWNIPHPHNIFFAFWLNAGILGFCALLGFIGFSHRRFTYPLIALWGILIHGLFDTPFWKNDLAMIFWLVLGNIVILQTYGTTSVKRVKAGKKKLAKRRR